MEVATERVLVCVGPSPGSARLVRAAHALATRLACPWTAAWVALPRPLGDEDQARVEHHLRVVETLGGEVVRLAGRDTAGALVAWARANGVTRILVGRPGTPRWRDLLFGSVVEDLVRAPMDVEVHVTVGADDPGRASGAGTRAAPDWARAGVVAVALVLIATALGRASAPILSDADVVMVYLLAVLLAGFRFGREAALVAATLSVAAYNWFFVPPFHTFVVADTRNLLTFGVLFGVGLAAGTLADRLRRQEADAVAREKRTAALLSLTRAAAGATDEHALARVVVAEAAARIADGAALYAPDVRAEAGAPGDPRAEGELVARALRDDVPVSAPGLAAYPVSSGDARLAVLLLRGPVPGTGDLADAWARQTALALTRARHAAAAEEATLRVRTEELRSALLATVSHDLRTPLAAITGAATTLLDTEVAVPESARRELLTSVRDEAARLERLVANLLEMTRIAAGPVVVRREWVPLEEIVGAAFARVERTLAAHPTRVDVPADLPLVALDPVLFEHVLVNLLENAARHTPPATPIRLAARRAGDRVEIEVADEGPGFPGDDPTPLFDPFVRGAGAVGPGSGLGLAICRGIVQAHGGTIEALRPPEGGAAVVVRLPSGGEPPRMPPEESP
jgi:two-component system sensor histidine kinase KdpD